MSAIKVKLEKTCKLVVQILKTECLRPLQKHKVEVEKKVFGLNYKLLVLNSNFIWFSKCLNADFIQISKFCQDGGVRLKILILNFLLLNIKNMYIYLQI